MNVLIDGVQYVPAEEVSELPEGYLSPHFRESEFDCNHCGKYGAKVSLDVVDVLEKLRAHFGGRPVTLNSGVRCPFHNSHIDPPGAPNSLHLSDGSKAGYPCAADVVVSGIAAANVYSYFVEQYPDKYGIGRYNSFTHIDTRPGGPSRW